VLDRCDNESVLDRCDNESVLDRCDNECVLDRCDNEESMDTSELMSLSYHGVMNGRVMSNASAAGDAASQSSCPVLTNESDDVQRFLTSHAVNGGIIDLLIAYLTQLSQRAHLTW